MARRGQRAREADGEVRVCPDQERAQPGSVVQREARKAEAMQVGGITGLGVRPGDVGAEREGPRRGLQRERQGGPRGHRLGQFDPRPPQVQVAGPPTRAAIRGLG